MRVAQFTWVTVTHQAPVRPLADCSDWALAMGVMASAIVRRANVARALTRWRFVTISMRVKLLEAKWISIAWSR
jgi:hypothetical protein